ncbi:sigma-70 family RNA polymerase sigma factor [Bacillus pseudomycoides]|uniref:sigma-70 family RNA polymerase sigma factor n=1 Tax=Bacillus pseudomycoides TaxID=64104 RepID=UPI000BF16773|nr:sigma-70 family RNA polymerase sigma factor [Bacillus pseudomycoides]PEN09712.1 RNA polymerase subunit sigma [Bacillus pseudomycoides]
MTTEELFEQKQHLVIAAIKQRFGSVSIAAKIARLNNMDVDDLVQIGSVRLWELCLKYNPEKEKSFNQYAVIGIQGRILNELFEKGKTIKVPKNVKKEIRDEFNFQSIDLHKDGETINEYYAVSQINVEEDVVKSIEFDEKVVSLNKKEKFVLLQKAHGYTDGEIAGVLGVNTSTVSRLKNKAFKKVNPKFKSKRLMLTRKLENHLRQQVI